MATAWSAAANEVSAGIVSCYELRRGLGHGDLDCGHARTVLKVKL